jgi:hypothetical protein
MSHEYFNPNTDKSRFDYTAMQQEWWDFLSLDGGLDRLEPKVRSVYVAAFTSRHAEAFRIALEDCSVKWHDMHGVFSAEKFVCMAYGCFPLDREELDAIWANCFDYTRDQFDAIQASVDEQLDLGII